MYNLSTENIYIAWWVFYKMPYLNESDSYQDNGIYMCTVNNGIPDDKGSINQTGVTSINAKGMVIYT
jgi:hypothetical protein